MSKNKYVLLGVLFLFGAGLVATLYLRGKNIAVLNPAGIIATQQRDLAITVTLLMLIVVLPVFILTFAIAWKYRAGNKKAHYRPDWDGNKVLETTWWVVPFCVIAVLSGIIWKSSHDLDPFKPIQANAKPMVIQVVALQWKWLFIYPEEQIATVNYVQFPEDRPVMFELTADAPMNSFWIPQLGGQVYAMAGMKTQLHLIADEPGAYNGVSANLSGEGFAGMKFAAISSSQEAYDAWVMAVKASSDNLTIDVYQDLSKPSKNNPVAFYVSSEPSLYDHIISSFTTPPDTIFGPQQHKEEVDEHVTH